MTTEKITFPPLPERAKRCATISNTQEHCSQEEGHEGLHTFIFGSGPLPVTLQTAEEAGEVQMLRRQNTQLSELWTQIREENAGLRSVIENQRNSINELCAPQPRALDTVRALCPGASVTIESRASWIDPCVQWPEGHELDVWHIRVTKDARCMSYGGHTLAEAIEELRASISRVEEEPELSVECPDCRGSGQNPDAPVGHCRACRGRGEARR